MSRPLATFVLVLLAAGARAECPTITARVDALAPEDGATGLPVNAAIAFGLTPRFAGYQPAVTLTATSGGAPIAGALLAGPAESYLFRPDLPLSPDQSYEILVVDSAGGGESASATFTTGSGTDTTDPVISSAPTLTIVGYTDPVRESDCLQPGYWVIEADWEDVAGEASVLYALDAQFIDLIPQEITAAEAQALVSADSRRTFNAPEDSELRVRIHAIDGAGRQGISPEAVLVTPPAPGDGGGGGCRCSLDGTEDPLRAGNVAGVLGAGLVLGLVAGFLGVRSARNRE